MTYEVIPSSSNAGEFYVYDSNGNRVAGPFKSKTEAQRWIANQTEVQTEDEVEDPVSSPKFTG